jgi:hypothetical protein
MIFVLFVLHLSFFCHSLTIPISKHMGSNVKKPKMLFCYGFQNGITNEKEDVMFATKLELFFIGTISLP